MKFTYLFIIFILFSMLLNTQSFASDYSSPKATIETCRDFSNNQDVRLFTECLTLDGKIRFFMFLLLATSLNNIEDPENIENNKKLKEVEIILKKYNFKGQLDNPEEFEDHLKEIDAESLYKKLFIYADIEDIWDTFKITSPENILNIKIDKEEAEVTYKIISDNNINYGSYYLKLEEGKWLLKLPKEKSPNNKFNMDSGAVAPPPVN